MIDDIFYYIQKEINTSINSKHNRMKSIFVHHLSIEIGLALALVGVSTNAANSDHIQEAKNSCNGANKSHNISLVDEQV